eukprot:222993-Prorocentrum_minimum.AAC.1
MVLIVKTTTDRSEPRFREFNTFSGKLDDLFHYSTVRTLVIRDRRLGMLARAGQVRSYVALSNDIRMNPRTNQTSVAKRLRHIISGNQISRLTKVRGLGVRGRRARGLGG